MKYVTVAAILVSLSITAISGDMLVRAFNAVACIFNVMVLTSMVVNRE
jgi:hypothetical protein